MKTGGPIAAAEHQLKWDAWNGAFMEANSQCSCNGVRDNRENHAGHNSGDFPEAKQSQDTQGEDTIRKERWPDERKRAFAKARYVELARTIVPELDSMIRASGSHTQSSQPLQSPRGDQSDPGADLPGASPELAPPSSDHTSPDVSSASSPSLDIHRVDLPDRLYKPFGRRVNRLSSTTSLAVIPRKRLDTSFFELGRSFFDALFTYPGEALPHLIHALHIPTCFQLFSGYLVSNFQIRWEYTHLFLLVHSVTSQANTKSMTYCVVESPPYFHRTLS